MTPSNSMCTVPNYGSSASYCDLPTEEQIRAGVVPLDSLPAAWWNAMWACTNGEVNKARDMLGQLIVELNSVLTQAGICACSSCTDQLYQSINKIRQTLANASVAGAVKSSSQPSEIAVDANGYMTVNCLGNAASLTTSASTVVGAINELKSTYDTCWSNNTTALSGKAPTSHASSATTYGVGSAGDYGHLKISDTYTCVLSACSGVAASQKAMACVYAVASAAYASSIALGNSAGCALGTAAAGTATTAARSDHVHPKQTCVACAGANGSGTAFGTAATCAASAFLAASGCAADSAKLGGRTAAQFIRNCNGSDLGVNANLGTYHTMTVSGPNACWNHLLSMGWGECAGTDTWASQISVPSQNSTARMGYRCHCNNSTNNSWQGWIYLIDTRGGQTINGDLTATNFCGALLGCACCAGRNGSGTAFGSAATLNKRAAASGVTYVEYTGANGCCLLAGDFLAYWNGAYNNTGSSNLKYTSVGALGTAAACAATAFRSCTWLPNYLLSSACGTLCLGYWSTLCCSRSTPYEERVDIIDVTNSVKHIQKFQAYAVCKTGGAASTYQMNCTCFCVCVSGNNEGSVFLCNKSTTSFLLYVINSACYSMCFGIVPPKWQSTMMGYCFYCGSASCRCMVLQWI